jgi:hypothetical protein
VIHREQAVTTIIRSLAPYVGENMARAATLLHCEKLDLGAPELAEEDVERLLKALAPGLHVFIGRAKTEDALDQIRLTLGAGRRSP